MAERAMYDLDLTIPVEGSRNRFMSSLTNMLQFITNYQPPDGGEGRIYHVCRTTVSVSTIGTSHPVEIVGNATDIQSAVSKLEKISGYKLKKA
mgnify:CR=1 FL=1